MKTNKKILLILISILLTVGCDDLQYAPSDQLTDQVVEQSEELMQNVLIGIYSRTRESNYHRLRHFTQELPGDDLEWCKQSGDHINNTYGYRHIVNSAAALNFWRQAYYGIYQTNKLIDIIGDNTSEKHLQMKGEALFLRALMHFDLVRIFGRPYSQNPETNLGVMIRNDIDPYALPPRSTVKETYDFIVADFLQVAELLKEDKANIFATKEAAWALLARIYLYMDNFNKAIEYADKVINSGKFELINTERLAQFYTLARENNSEIIYAIKLIPSENLGKASIGSLYHEKDGGWGEIFVSKTYREFIYENPNDERIKFIDPDFVLDNNGNKIPDATEASGFRVQKRLGYSKYMNLKYTRQEGVKLLASPVVTRLAEMYLIKAEAYAKTSREGEALEMVNIIRQRAGLFGEQLFKLDDLKGYESVLDIVLDERRLELAWEGHRSHDVFRNNRSLDRSYTFGEAWAGPQTILPNSPLIVHFIPQVEMTLNPNLEQNP